MNDVLKMQMIIKNIERYYRSSVQNYAFIVQISRDTSRWEQGIESLIETYNALSNAKNILEKAYQERKRYGNNVDLERYLKAVEEKELNAVSAGTVLIELSNKIRGII